VNTRAVLLAFVLAVVPALAAAQAPESRLQKIKTSKSIAIAYRTDASPFSMVDAAQQPTGYSIDLCKRVVSLLEQQLGIQGLQIKWVPVTIQTRFSAVAGGQADMECGASTVTLGRMKQVDFSYFTFLEGTGLLARAELNVRSLGDLAGKKIGVVGGTTNETALRNALRDRVVNATVVTLTRREEGLQKLEAKEIDALASDMLLLLGLAPKAKDPRSLVMVDDPLSFEPYAIALPRGESGLRIEVNTALAKIYRSDAILDLYGRWFGSIGKPGAMLRVMYTLGALAD
jgi:glutamate/aspartate transport system substrate-binding protein